MMGPVAGIALAAAAAAATTAASKGASALVNKLVKPKKPGGSFPGLDSESYPGKRLLEQGNDSLPALPDINAGGPARIPGGGGPISTPSPMGLPSAAFGGGPSGGPFDPSQDPYWSTMYLQGS